MMHAATNPKMLAAAIVMNFLCTNAPIVEFRSRIVDSGIAVLAGGTNSIRNARRKQRAARGEAVRQAENSGELSDVRCHHRYLRKQPLLVDGFSLATVRTTTTATIQRITSVCLRMRRATAVERKETHISTSPNSL
jgi:hypothetical protein